MGEQTSGKSPVRLFHLDNFRIYLTILVIFHHTSIAYGGAGDWMVVDPGVDEISPIVLTFFNVVNQSYFMAAFFLLAGYFTPRSLEKKGARGFLKDRLIRLGIPLLIYTTLILNINEYLGDVYLRKAPFTPIWDYAPGHLWFLQALLIFAVIYVVYRSIADRNPLKKRFQYYPDRFPPNTALGASILSLTLLTFLVRVKFPVGEWVGGLQLGHFTHYIFAFYAGILARRGSWFDRLPQAQARQWGFLSLAVIPLFFPLVIFGGLLENEANLVKFVGGVHWQAFVYAFWESILFIGINILLIYFFRERFSQAGDLARSMAKNVYTVYIIHQTVLFGMNILFLSVGIPTLLKFIIVGVVSVPLCFLLSALIRKIPYVDRVLG